MSNWQDTPVHEWTAEDKKEMWRDMRKEAWDGWKIVFFIQLIMGSHILYENAAQYPDMGLFYYAFMLLLVTAIAATILFVLITIFLFIVGACVVAFMMWRENKRER